MEQPGGVPRPPPKDSEVCRTQGEELGCGGFFSHGSVPPGKEPGVTWGKIQKQARGTLEDAEEKGFHTHTLLDGDNARSPHRFF